MKTSLYNTARALFQQITIYETSIFAGVFIALLIARIWLSSGIPLILIGGPHDDFFFVKAAHYMIQGDWMGPYNQMTLIKGPFYAFFLIFSYLTGLPLFLNESIFYIVACIILFYALRPLIKNKWLRLPLFILLLFCPSSLATNVNNWVYREFVYYSLTLYIVAFSTGLFLRIEDKISRLLLWSIGLGTSMGAFMITREEGIWIYPILLLLLSCCLFFIWKGEMDRKLRRAFLVVLPILLWCLPILGVSYLNYSHYGYWGTTEMLDPNFNRVLNTLGRIKVDTAYPHVQVTHEALRKAYLVSPQLSTLKKVIKDITPPFLQHSSAGLSEYPDWYLQEYSDHGSEIGRGHFLWVMREAAYANGYYAEGKYPHEFYRQLADELEAACESGELDCVPKITFPIKRRFIPVILRMFYDSAFGILDLERVHIIPTDLKTWWPEESGNTTYFNQLIYNPMDRPEFDKQIMAKNSINGNTDLRIVSIHRKARIMNAILTAYQGFTAPAFVISFAAWIVLIILSISKKQRDVHMPFLVISIFMIGLIFSRLTTLVIAVGGASTRYGMSIHLFMYTFIFILIYWCVNHLPGLLSGTVAYSQLNKKDGSKSS